MSLKVSVSRTGTAGSQLTPRRVQSTLFSACEDTIVALQRLMQEELLKRLSNAVITDEAKERILALANLDTLLKRYSRCFRIEIADTEVRLILDRRLLQTYGLPAQLPELLEYGSEIGISPMAHLRTAPRRLQREVIPGIFKDIRRAFV